MMKLMENIEKRKKSESLMMLAIIQNPFSEHPERLVNELTKDMKEESDYDKQSIERFKGAMRRSKFIRVKNGT